MFIGIGQMKLYGIQKHMLKLYGHKFGLEITFQEKLSQNADICLFKILHWFLVNPEQRFCCDKIKTSFSASGIVDFLWLWFFGIY